MPYRPPDHHPAFEEYCETIFGLCEDGVDVIQARIAERLEVSRPAVSEMVRRMEREGLVTLPDSGEIALTSEGEVLAEQVVRRHRLAERFLTDVLQLNWTDAHHEAGKWEHVISPVVEAAMFRVLGDLTTCPHGNPIPGAGYDEPPTATTLADIAAGGPFVVARIPEELEYQPDQLSYLEHAGLVPGNEGTVLVCSPDGTLTVDVAGRSFGVGPFIAERILVVPGS